VCERSLEKRVNVLKDAKTIRSKPAERGMILKQNAKCKMCALEAFDRRTTPGNKWEGGST